MNFQVSNQLLDVNGRNSNFLVPLLIVWKRAHGKLMKSIALAVSGWWEFKLR